MVLKRWLCLFICGLWFFGLVIVKVIVFCDVCFNCLERNLVKNWKMRMVMMIIVNCG